MNVPKTFLLELLPTRKKKGKNDAPTRNCDLTCKKKKEKEETSIKNIRDVDVADHSSSKTKNKQENFPFFCCC